MATRMYFYIDSRNQRQGPVQANQLPMLGVTLNTYVWTEGMKDWDVVANIAELRHIFNPIETEQINSRVSASIPDNSETQIADEQVEVYEVEEDVSFWKKHIMLWTALGLFLVTGLVIWWLSDLANSGKIPKKLIGLAMISGYYGLKSLYLYVKGLFE